MRNFICSKSEFKTFYREINKELCDKFENILEGSGVYVITEKDSAPELANQARTFWGIHVEIYLNDYCTSFWSAGQKISEDSWEIQVEFVVDVFIDSPRSTLYLNPKDFFQDWINPTEVELESFEQETGYPYSLSKKFIKDISQQPNVKCILRRA